MAGGTDTQGVDVVMVDLGEKFPVRRQDLSRAMRLTGADLAEEIRQKYGSVAQLCAKLRTDPSHGIPGDPSDIRSREDSFGRNTIPLKKPLTFLQLCWSALKDPTLLILEVAAIISLVLSLYGNFIKSGISTAMLNSTTSHNATQPGVLSGSTWNSTFNTTDTEGDDLDPDTEYEWIEAAAIGIAVTLVVLVTAVNDYGKEKQFQALQDRVRKEQKVTVLRTGKQQVITTDDLVVGDIFSLKYGDVVPADGLVLSSHDLTVDESSLTGESDFVRKCTDSDIRVLSGTNVMEGTGKILVLAVGIYSQTGMIHVLLGTSEKHSEANDRCERHDPDDKSKLPKRETRSDGEEVQSFLQKKLTRIALQIGYVGLAFAVVTSFALIIRFCVKEFGEKGRRWNAAVEVNKILGAIIIGITILVVAIPEGLPLAVTLTLAVSTKKMMKYHNLVRNLFACETMGCATTICLDKTGTLTTNRMTVTECYLGGKEDGGITIGSHGTTTTRLLDLTAEGISVNSSYTTNVTTPIAIGDSLPVQVGNKTECALLYFAKRIGYDYQVIRDDNPEDSFAKVYTFNSNRRSMSTVICTEAGWRVHSKGAAEVVLAK
ncbi:Plasma membrane calcium-transporting ATPase 3 [Hypsibius exemplaris]|uniref:Plasma membrane calcium-transporting ATPase 3 n=1 Tax=Hypsibius exemplaris TaxID=2072580 RepID=A0A1W0WWK8_HYPEX|nr:Plasma membrane calcium-transporting ATPase 3 [Hypsibius exemplaris]